MSPKLFDKQTRRVLAMTIAAMGIFLVFAAASDAGGPLKNQKPMQSGVVFSTTSR